MTKVVILAGGKGTRISEETKNIPKPMIRIGDKPILHHIMDGYISQGVNEFVILCGYKSEIIYGYFFSLASKIENSVFQTDEWKVTLVQSGIDSQTGGRLKKAQNFVNDDFFFTYGDGLSDVDIQEAMNRHKQCKAIATLSGVRPIPRFGSILFDAQGKVLDFGEKQEHLWGWINGGFSVLSPEIFQYIDSDECNLEKDVYPKLVKENKLFTVTHDGFWQCVDTLRDWELLDEIYKDKGAIWIK